VRKHALILLALLIIPLFCAVSFVRELSAADSALDSGASFDYSRDVADHSVNRPFIPFSQRHGTLLVISGISLVVAIAYASYATSAMLRSRAI
jgi:hypothetical protein